MSTAAERAKDKAARLSSRPVASAPSTEVGELVAPAPAVPVRAQRKKVRMSFDMAPALHADLGDWTAGASRQLGHLHVSRVDVLRVLVRQLLDDEQLQAQVIQSLRSGQ
jgi:hypothetical protein